MDGHRSDGGMYGWQKTLKKLRKEGSEMRAEKQHWEETVPDSLTWDKLGKKKESGFRLGHLKILKFQSKVCKCKRKEEEKHIKENWIKWPQTCERLCEHYEQT